MINLELKSPRSRLAPAPKLSFVTRVGHFFDPAKAIAFEEKERRKVFWFLVFFVSLIAADILYVHYLDSRRISAA